MDQMAYSSYFCTLFFFLNRLQEKLFDEGGFVEAYNPNAQPFVWRKKLRGCRLKNNA
jgi:hypothetical protein